MRKLIKKYGDSLIIRFSPDEVIAYNISEGKIFDVEIKEIDNAT